MSADFVAYLSLKEEINIFVLGNSNIIVTFFPLRFVRIPSSSIVKCSNKAVKGLTNIMFVPVSCIKMKVIYMQTPSTHTTTLDNLYFILSF